MADIKDRAREYLAEHSEYSEVFGETFVAVDTLTAMVNFAEQETKELEVQIEKLQKINNEQKETLKKVRVALIQERTANIMNYGKGGVEMFDDCFEILKGVSN